MTLDQIANQVCIKTHDTSAGAVAAVKTFCKNRYQMIWDSQLWANSMAVTTQAISSGSSIVTISDTNMDLPVAVKIGTTAIDPANYGSAFMMSPSSFTDSGNTTSFVILSRSDAGNIRLQLLSAASESGTLSVLCKTKIRVTNNGVSAYRSMEQDDDVCVINTAEQALLTLVEADMLEYKQAYAKAQAKQSEALTLLSLARNVERSQGASRFEVSAAFNGEWSRDDWDYGGSTISFQ